MAGELLCWPLTPLISELTPSLCHVFAKIEHLPRGVRETTLSGWHVNYKNFAITKCITIEPPVCPFQVCTEGRLILEFTFDDLMRIKTWHFTIRQYRELVPRSILAMHVSTLISISLSSLSSPPHLTQKREALFSHYGKAPRDFHTLDN